MTKILLLRSPSGNASRIGTGRRASGASTDRVSDTGGFTLVEVVVAVAIMVMMAATITPSVINAIDRTRQERGASTLVAVDSAITRFRTAVGQYPRNLSQLSTPILGTDVNSCGTVFGNTRAALWAGPYLSRIITPTGFRAFVGTAQNLIIRTPATANTPPPTLTIRLAGARQEDAEALEQMLDSDGTSTGGTIRWTSAPSGEVQLDYVRSTLNC